MIAKIPLILLAALLLAPLRAPAFVNLDFENATIVSNDPLSGFLDWNLAAPGWSHSSGSDTSIIYYGNAHVGTTQYYMLYSAQSPQGNPGTQLAGNYSMALASGASSSTSGAPFTQAFLSQTGTLAANVQSVRLLAQGAPFQVMMGGIPIPMIALGGNAYAGDISAFAGTTTEFKFVNTSTSSQNPVVVDNIQFSTVAAPEPSAALLSLAGLLSLGLRRRRLR